MKFAENYRRQTVFNFLAELLLTLLFVTSAKAQIVSVLPAQHALNVPNHTNIEVSFSLDINAATINSATFRVYGAQSGYHPGTVNYIAASKKVVFTPALPFFPGEVVYVALANGIMTSGGLPLNKFAWHFTTAVTISSGQFANKNTVAVGNIPRSIAGADFDRDGDIDLAVANSGGNTISILKNNGDTTFQEKQDFVTGYYSYFVVTGDWDADGDMDLAIAHSDGSIEEAPRVDTDSVTILKNNGNGGFQTKKRYPITRNSASIYAADVDGDGDIDLIVPNSHIGATATILKNDGNGLFNDKVILPTDYGPIAAFSSDVDNDGDMDVLIANDGWAHGGGTDGSVAIFKNSGNGFQTKVDYYRAGGWPHGVLVSDFDLDGDGDLVVPNFILKNKGDGSFQPPSLIPTAVSTEFISAADVDGDGDMDLAMASNVASIFKNKGDGTFLPQAYTTGNSLSGLLVADLDHDGDMDLAVSNHKVKSVTVLLNRGLALTNPLVLNFGSVYIGYPKELSLTFYNYSPNSVSVANVVSNNSKFAVIGRTAFTVGAGDSVKIAVRYTPTSAMSDTGSIGIFPSAAPSERVAVSGTGLTPVAILSATPTALAFGSVTIAKTSDLIINLSNTGLADLMIMSIVNNNSYFSVAGGPTLTIRSQETKSIAVRFTVPFIGSQSDTLKLFSNDGTNNPLKIPMSAIGTASSVNEISVQTAQLQFDSVVVKQAKILALKIYNHGAANLSVNNITSNNTKFTVTTPINFTLPPGDSNTVNVKFSPVEVGLQTGMLTIPNNDANENPLNIRMNGIGKATLSPVLTGITPASGNRLEMLNVGFKGANFISGTTSVNVGSNITVNNTTVHRPDSLTANITIAANAATGTRNFYVINGGSGGSASGNQTFTITNPVPALTSIAPAVGTRGQTLNVVFTGSNFISGVTTVNVGAGIKLNSITINTNFKVTANITITTAASKGLYNFSVTNVTPGGGISNTKLFTVNNDFPKKPELLSPANNTIIQLSKPALPIKFVWSKSFDADPEDIIKYIFNIKGPGFDTTGTVIKDTSVTLNIMSRLRAASTYSWGLHVSDGTVTMNWPDRATFLTSSTVTVVHERDNLVPSEYLLEQNYPNPFSLAAKNAATTIKYQLPKASFVTLKVFDMLGREMIALVNAQQPPGFYNVAWNGHNADGQLVPGGVYLCRLQAGSFERVMKMMLLR